MNKENNNSRTRVCIDPPGGWRYGFPKPIPDQILDEKSLREFLPKWLEEEGYPPEEIEFALKNSRYFNHTEEVK